MTRSQILFARIIGMLEVFQEMHLPYDTPDIKDTPSRLPFTPPATEQSNKQEETQPNSPSRGVGRLNLVFLCLLALFLQSCEWVPIDTQQPGGSINTPNKGSVRVVYLIPRDKLYNSAYVTAISRAMQELQGWYGSQLNGRTFSLQSSGVDVLIGDQSSSWYRQTPNGSNPDTYAYYNVAAEVGRKLGAKFYDPNYAWVIYVDANTGGLGAPSICVLGEFDLQGLIGKNTERPDFNRWVGGLGHELGHAFGLPHASASDPNAIMLYGYASYPNCYLTASDKATLLASPFFKSY